MRDIIISYDMVANVSPSELCHEVRRRITDGWEPVGGPVIWTDGRFTAAHVWYQAIVKRAPPPMSSHGDA